MPEGDTIFKLAAYLAPALGGRQVVSGFALAKPKTDLAGLGIRSVHAQGKHLFIGFDNGQLLRNHLGMWGSWHSYRPSERWLRPKHRASIVIDVGDRVYVCFNAQQVELLREGGVRNRQLAATLGPDLLKPAIDFNTLPHRARTLGPANRLLADVLLDQAIACGIGNVYKSETLFLEQAHPMTPLDLIDDAQLIGLYERAAELLHDNTKGGPRITRRANDDAGHLWVYGRTAQPCLRCDTPIASKMMGTAQRSTFWCPRCQPARHPVKRS